VNTPGRQVPTFKPNFFKHGKKYICTNPLPKVAKAQDIIRLVFPYNLTDTNSAQWVPSSPHLDHFNNISALLNPPYCAEELLDALRFVKAQDL
jgi:hypothetical protein